MCNCRSHAKKGGGGGGGGRADQSKRKNDLKCNKQGLYGADLSPSTAAKTVTY